MHITPTLGSDLATEIRKCIGIASMLNETVWLTFNDVRIAFKPGTSFDTAYAAFLIEQDQHQSQPPKPSKHAEWLKDPEYAKAYAQEGVLMEFWEGLLGHLEENEVTLEEVRQKARITPDNLKKLMAGEEELTVRQAGDLCHIAGYRMVFK